MKKQWATKDIRSHGRWIWAAVTVGKGDQIYNHENGKKRFTFAILPRKAEAPHGKPRGLVSIKKVLSEHVAEGSFLVFDQWQATVSATKALGYRSAPPVNHSKEFRDKDTGFHSNDIESEFNLIKKFVRERYGILTLTDDTSVSGLEAGDIYEHMFYVNIGNDMWSIMKALTYASGGKCASIAFEK